LLSKWLFKLLNEDGLWQQLLRNKYIESKTLGSCVKKASDSHFWKSLMNIKDMFMQLGHFVVKDGSQTRFWFDTWLGNKPLKTRFPELFSIVRRKHDTIATVMSSPNLNISFRRNLVGANLRNWNQIVASLQQVNLLQDRDVFVWGLQASGVYTVKSLYAVLINNGVRVSQDIWQTKPANENKNFHVVFKKRGYVNQR